ncbi:MAG: hypothetical protein IJ685_07480 [Selenomonadaceae bacterium]|nr:hypothetical protein [Selenomonadaceae bacterium]
MNAKLKTVRKEMTAGDLKGIIDLPNYDDNQRVKITVTPAEPVAEKKILSDEEINALLDDLTGCLKDADKSKTLEDWRTERLEERYGLAY